MTIEEYLQSEKARKEIGKVLDSGNPLVEWGRGIQFLRAGAWMHIDVGYEGTRISAYIRSEGERYIVTDLGEGAKALRVRTGQLFDDHCRSWFNGIVRCADGMIFPFRDPAVSADVPAAICAVLLASYRVSVCNPLQAPR